MIFIQFNTPSSKNSKIATKKGVFHSKTVRKYLQKLGVKKYSMAKKKLLNGESIEDYVKRPNLFRKAVGNYFDNVEYPCILGFHFVRDTKRKFDYINAMQIICDLLVAHRFIEDDDCDHLIPGIYFMNKQFYSIDKENPGVYLKIMK